MKPIFYLFTCCAALLLCKEAKTQDIHFSQMFETPLLRNPALAGIFSGDIRVQTVYRSQYNAVSHAYQTTSANMEYKMLVTKDDYLTMGAQVLYDKAGTVSLTSTHILPALNYHKSLSDERNMYLSLGVMGGYVQRRIDPSKITTNSQYDGDHYNELTYNGETFPSPSYSYFDGSVGMSFNTELGSEPENNMYIGFAYHHFNKAKKVSFYTQSNIELTPKYVASAGIRTSTSDYNYITIEADYTRQGAYKEIIGGLLYSMKLESPDEPRYIVHGGAYIRWNDAIIPVVKLDVKPMSFAMSYDMNISKLAQGSKGRGGFELSIVYQKFLDRQNTTLNATRCPRF
ncbi:PorP/SprF family type IX secretion system membrane protein [Ferruginibacter sp. HRS2-29]|uniref:PorP/SprF family type IX secretion system membrane protein n=1 Tax=Ferruginibacter sp. HRS2-29 TaxID=2487334 RepID=UPI0020CEFC8F|nr:PorP/SprF family type IX secretion system membrane protein [Ferruginibacter sp. HRS2-29]MCP9751205.1 type IX secretion system membrane protein PorP/SprF [Ferruginibacter sp. HRS2-29]